MAKKVAPEEGVEENMFEAFKIMDEAVPAAVANNETKVTSKKEEKAEAARLEAEQKALEEAAAAAERKSSLRVEESESIETEEEPEEEEVEEEEDNSKESEYSVYAKHMYEKGLLDLDDEDVIETEEDLERLQRKTIDNGIGSYKQSLPEDGQKFLEFVENGGNPSDFHKYYYSDGSFEDFDLESEENQKYVIRQALELEGYTPEEVEDEINDTIDLGKLDKKAAVHLKKLQKIEKEQKALLLESQKNYAKEQEAIRVREWETFKKGLFDKEAIAGFKMTPKSKQDLWDYMTKPIDKKTGLTAYQKDSKENEDARYMFAYLLKNKWDIKSLERQVTTKAVGKLAAKLSNYTDTRAKIKQGVNHKEEVNDNSFAAFKNANI